MTLFISIIISFPPLFVTALQDFLIQSFGT